MATFKEGWPDMIRKLEIKTPFDYNSNDFWGGNYIDCCMYGIRVILSVPLFPFVIAGFFGAFFHDMLTSL